MNANIEARDSYLEFSMLLANHVISYKAVYPKTRELFGEWAVCDGFVENDFITVSKERMLLARKLLGNNVSDSAVEFRALIGLTSRRLLSYRACIFHSVSFVFKGKAWLLAAESGVGKTTQYKNWQSLFPDEITMISGDMPVLECKGAKSVMVYPSPWNGKEGIGNNISAPLGGIVVLERGVNNNIQKLSPTEAFEETFNRFIVMPDTEQEIRDFLSTVDTVLRSCPIWKLTNLGDDESTMLLKETISNNVNQ